MRYNKKAIKKTVKKVGRKIYKTTGLVNPFKKVNYLHQDLLKM